MIIVILLILTLASPSTNSKLTTVEFFKTAYYKQQETNVVKQVSLSETIFFEVTDHYDTFENVSNWPINCWVTKNTSTNNENAVKFVYNGCQSAAGVSLYHNAPRQDVRVSFSLWAAAIRQLQEFLYVQCEYIKCFNSIDISDEHPGVMNCPTFGQCTKLSLAAYDRTELNLASSTVILVTVEKLPQEIQIPAAPPIEATAQPNLCNCNQNTESDDSDEGKEAFDDECSCTNVFKKCERSTLRSTSFADMKMSLPVVVAIAFSSFSVGLLLMAGLCWMGAASDKSDPVDSSINEFPSIKYDAASDQSVMLRKPSMKSIATYTSVLTDSYNQQMPFTEYYPKRPVEFRI